MVKKIFFEIAGQIKGIALGLTASLVIYLIANLVFTGQIPDSKIDSELHSRLSKELGKNIIIESKKEADIHGYGNDTIIYTFYSEENKGSGLFNGRHIAFFDKARSSIIDKLLHRATSYSKTVHSFYIDLSNDYDPDPSLALIPQSIEIIDLDNDGVKEVIVRLVTQWADMKGNSCLVFKWNGETYKISQLPDMRELFLKNYSFVKEEITDQSGEPMEVDASLWQHNFSVKSRSLNSIITLQNGGDFLFGASEESAKLMCYAKIENGSVLGPSDYIAFMFQWNGKEFEIYPNWNHGQIALWKRERLEKMPLDNLLMEGFKAHEVGSAIFLKEDKNQNKLTQYIKGISGEI